MVNDPDFTRAEIQAVFNIVKNGIVSSKTLNKETLEVYKKLACSNYFITSGLTGPVNNFVSHNGTASFFMKFYESTSIIEAVEKHVLCMAVPEPFIMTRVQLEVLQHAIEQGPIEDGDLISKSTRDELVAKGYIARIRVKGEEGFNAATYAGRYMFCQHFGTETLSDAYEAQLYKNLGLKSFTVK
jgi:hypothetical protein